MLNINALYLLHSKQLQRWKHAFFEKAHLQTVHKKK